MRRAFVIVGSVLLLSVGIPLDAAIAKDIARVPLCDLDGHCDRHCVVSTDGPPLRCGYGP